MEERKIEHIYWFAYYNLDSPSVRYRAKYPLDFARENLNISSNLIIPGYSLKRVLNFILGYFSALLWPKKNSLIIIQRVRSNFIYSNLLKLLVRARQKRTIYDLDDADYLELDPKVIYSFARLCNHISAGSLEIATHLKKINNNIIHTTSPIPDYGLVKRERNTVPIIGWIGGFGWGHKDSLYKYLFPALKLFKIDCQLVMLGISKVSDKNELIKYFEGHGNIRISIPNEINWNNERDIQKMISEFDVGIATLMNYPIQLAKSGIKAKQYMNNGIPVICNRLPENTNIVVDGFNGFICNSYFEFYERISEILNMDDDAYWKMSRNARKSIEEFNHMKFFGVLENVLN